MFIATLLFLLPLLALVAGAGPTIKARSPLNYAPQAAACPSQLIRKASGLNSQEAAYIKGRTSSTRAALSKWLKSTGGKFSTDTSTYPTLAMASSGGGFRAMLTGAGVHQAMDIRETTVTSGLKGLYQSLTWESGLSGGSWLLSSIAGNNWPTISSIRDNLWYKTLPLTPLIPGQPPFLLADGDITASIAAKTAAGYEPTIIDAYGRFLGYTLLEQPEGGVSQTMSSLSTLSGYTSKGFPFPIITAIQVPAVEQCMPGLNGTQFEFTPLEFGSWDSERAQFVPTKYTGSFIGSDGKKNCVTGYDNLGYVFGTSSNVFTYLCESDNSATTQTLQQTADAYASLLGRNNSQPTLRDLYAPYPDTFDKQSKPASNYPPTGRSSDYSELYLVDGGFSDQINPIWPFLYRDVDVLFVEDSGYYDQTQGYPDGSDVYNTYVQAKARGLKRMPKVPNNTTFVAKGYNTRPTFFGCNQPNAMTLIYLPNHDYVYASNTSTFKLSYTKPEIDGMLANGQAVATNNGTADFAGCVACAVMKKTSTVLPSSCKQCFTKYCAAGY
jgi:lysophospholipase